MANMPKTSNTLPEKLKDKDNHRLWQESWKRFFKLYHRPLLAMAHGIYFKHSKSNPSQETVEDIVSCVMVEFSSKNQFDPKRGNLRGYLRRLTNARTVDLLRKERPFQTESYDPEIHDGIREENGIREEQPNPETPDDRTIAIMTEFRKQAPARHVQIFEMVKLNGMKPEAVAAELGTNRGVIDNTILKSRKLLREIAGRLPLDKPECLLN